MSDDHYDEYKALHTPMGVDLSPEKLIEPPKWTVHYNMLCAGSKWIGTGWEFFDLEAAARASYARHKRIGNIPTMRPFHISDAKHLGAVHRIANGG